MSPRETIFRKAAETYLSQLKSQPEVMGVIFSGGWIRGIIDPNSDVDIYVILDESCAHRQRGNTWIDGVEIEYFHNPPQQIRRYFQQEKSPHTAHMLASGELVYATSPIVQELIEEAKQLLAVPLSAPNSVKKELWKYHLDDLRKDWTDCLDRGDRLASALIKAQLIQTCVEIFCGLHRIRPDKNKRLPQQLAQLDRDFPQLLAAFSAADWNQASAFAPLRKKMAELLGGERTEEWVLRSSLDLT